MNYARQFLDDRFISMEMLLKDHIFLIIKAQNERVLGGGKLSANDEELFGPAALLPTLMIGRR